MNNSPNNQFDEFIRESLKNHEVPYDEAHWKEFESKLNAAKPKANTFRKWSFSLNMFIGLLVAGSASAFIYSSVSDSSSPKNNDNTITNTVKNVQADKTTQPQAPVVVNTGSDNNYSAFASADISHEVSAITLNTAKVKPLSLPAASSPGNQIAANDKIDPAVFKKVLKDAKNSNGGPLILFPDMIDSKKGPIYKTKESDTIKEKAVYDFTYFNLLYKKDANGNKVADADSVKNFFDNAQKKNDSGPVKPNQQKSENNTVPADSLKNNISGGGQ